MKTDSHTHFDIIIAGTGAAGLSLALSLVKHHLGFSKILLVDVDQKLLNDRTWCYWSNNTEDWMEKLHTRTWSTFRFIGDDLQLNANLDAYNYNLIRGIDFYRYAKTVLKADARFQFAQETILSLSTEGDKAVLQTDQHKYTANFVFNSAVRAFDIRPHHNNLVQHFVGWKIRCNQNVFNPQCPVFMDFSVEQFNDCRFVYVLPFSEREALVEYTGFSKQALTQQEYATLLENYIARLGNNLSYEILETEAGKIPMYESAAQAKFGKRVISIGTAGGASKASTGFTWTYIHKHNQQIISALQQNQLPKGTFSRKKRFVFYDQVLLQVLSKPMPGGKAIFTALFRRNQSSTILAFLNEETTLWQEIKLFLTLPIKPFLHAAIKKLLQHLFL